MFIIMEVAGVKVVKKKKNKYILHPYYKIFEIVIRRKKKVF